MKAQNGITLNSYPCGTLPGFNALWLAHDTNSNDSSSLLDARRGNCWPNWPNQVDCGSNSHGTHTHTYTDTYIYIYIYIYIHAYIHTSIHAYMHAHMHTYLHAYIHKCIHACIHTCIHTYKHTNILTYLHYTTLHYIT